MVWINKRQNNEWWILSPPINPRTHAPTTITIVMYHHQHQSRPKNSLTWYRSHPEMGSWSLCSTTARRPEKGDGSQDHMSSPHSVVRIAMIPMLACVVRDKKETDNEW